MREIVELTEKVDSIGFFIGGAVKAAFRLNLGDILEIEIIQVLNEKKTKKLKNVFMSSVIKKCGGKSIFYKQN